MPGENYVYLSVTADIEVRQVYRIGDAAQGVWPVDEIINIRRHEYLIVTVDICPVSRRKSGLPAGILIGYHGNVGKQGAEGITYCSRYYEPRIEQDINDCVDIEIHSRKPLRRQMVTLERFVFEVIYTR